MGRNVRRGAAWLLGLTLALGIVVPADAANDKKNELSDEDKACLECHDKPDVRMKLGDGSTLSLRVSTKAYLESMHGGTSCEDCHDSIDAKTHGKGRTELASHRELSRTMQDSCTTCHKKHVKSYADSLHATLAKAGSEKAPLCSDCHTPHTQPSVKLAQPVANTPCGTCHDAILTAYATDVHGKERAAKGTVAPICADCHKAHDIQAAQLGDALKDACMRCHDKSLEQHRDWLPNTGLHFEAISCPACHSPGATRRVNLRLYEGAAQVVEKKGVPRFEQQAKAAAAGAGSLDERALWSLLREFNRDDTNARTVLRGRLEVTSGAEAHQIGDKATATKDCASCHRQGAEPFQSVILTVASADGRPLRAGVDKDVLSSLTALESVRGFYALGSTRIRLLDDLLLLVVAGSIGGVAAHAVVRRLFKSMRERRAAAATRAPGSDRDAT